MVPMKCGPDSAERGPIILAIAEMEQGLSWMVTFRASPRFTGYEKTSGGLGDLWTYTSSVELARSSRAARSNQAPFLQAITFILLHYAIEFLGRWTHASYSLSTGLQTDGA